MKLDNKRVLIVSDIHFGEKNPVGGKKFINFLNSYDDYDVLVLLGDIFDLFWDKIEIKYHLNEKLLNTLSKLNKKIVFIPGNHDFWGKSILTKMGILYKKTGFLIEQNNKRFYLLHGDGFNKYDKLYKVLEVFSKNDYFKFFLNLVTNGTILYKIFAPFSKTHPLRGYNFIEINSLREASKKIAKKYNLDGVIFGHTHYPEIINYKNFIYANAGDWLMHFSYLILENGEITLNFYK